MQDTQILNPEQETIKFYGTQLSFIYSESLSIFRRSIQQRLEKLWLDAEELPSLFVQKSISPDILEEKLNQLAFESTCLAQEINFWSGYK